MGWAFAILFVWIGVTVFLIVVFKHFNLPVSDDAMKQTAELLVLATRLVFLVAGFVSAHFATTAIIRIMGQPAYEYSANETRDAAEQREPAGINA